MKLSLAQSLLLLLPITLLSCSAGTDTKPPDGKNDTALYRTKLSDPHLSKLELEEQLSDEIRQSLTLASDTMVEEAAAVVAETRNAIRYLLANKTAEAQKSIESAIGKAEVVTATKPNMNLVPLDVNVTVYDHRVRFAEALGYGKRDNEFKEFYAAITSLKKEVTGKSSSSRNSNMDLRNKLDFFVRRISPKTPAKRS